MLALWSITDYHRNIYAIGDMKRYENAEQGVPGYGPQVIAWRWPPLAELVILTARGPLPEP